MSHSSIFSFETWQGPPPWSKVLLIVCAVVFTVEFGLARQDAIWTLNEQSSVGMVPAIERVLIQNATHPPDVIFMGSSRMRDGVSPTLVADALNLPSDKVTNLSLTGGSTSDVLRMYRKNRVWFQQAKVLVVGIEDWMFNASRPPGDRFFFEATLEERLGGMYSDKYTLPLLIGWIWRTYEAQYALRSALKVTLKRTNPPLSFSKDRRPIWNIKNQGPNASRHGPKLLDVTADVELFYKDYIFSTARLDELKTIAEMADKDGLKLVFVQIPLRDAYMRSVRDTYAKHYTRYIDAVRSVPKSHLLLYESGETLGIPDTGFRDYGHAAPSGTEKISARLAQDIKKFLPKTTTPHRP